MTALTSVESLFMRWWNSRRNQNEVKALSEHAFAAGHSFGWRDGYEAAVKAFEEPNNIPAYAEKKEIDT